MKKYLKDFILYRIVYRDIIMKVSLVCLALLITAFFVPCKALEWIAYISTIVVLSLAGLKYFGIGGKKIGKTLIIYNDIDGYQNISQQMHINYSKGDCPKEEFKKDVLKIKPYIENHSEYKYKICTHMKPLMKSGLLELRNDGYEVKIEQIGKHSLRSEKNSLTWKKKCYSCKMRTNCKLMRKESQIMYCIKIRKLQESEISKKEQASKLEKSGMSENTKAMIQLDMELLRTTLIKSGTSIGLTEHGIVFFDTARYLNDGKVDGLNIDIDKLVQ